MFISKDLLRYLLKFILSFCFLYYGTKAIIGLSSPGGYYSSFVSEYLDYIKWFRYALLYSAKVLLSVSGYKVVIQNMYILRMYNGAGVRLVYSCLGFGIMSFWAAFIFANKASGRKKIVWILSGWAAFFFINVIRIALLL